MNTQNVAHRVIWPTDENVLVRAVFLYVGQGDCTLILTRNGSEYDIWVVDINLDRTNGGIDAPRLVADLAGGSIRAFVNTHPHDDHLCGITELADAVDIEEILHSGHKPSKKYGTKHSDLLNVIKKVKEAGGVETLLEGSNSSVSVGDAEYHVLAPAKHVTDDVNDETAETRRSRIHEQCGVIKFGAEGHWVMLSGDADRAAFEEHITEYHKDNLPAFALSASHHGSRTFFKENEEDDPYLTALETIDPKYVFVSAPTQKESRHDHPHDSAMELYKEHVGVDNVYHTGEERYSFIVDIVSGNGYGEVSDDGGDLAAEYGFDDEPEDEGKASTTNASGPFQRPRSQTGDSVPRKYGI